MKSILGLLSFLLVALSVTAQNDTKSLEYNESDELFKVVEEMPRFPGCEELSGDQNDKKDCSLDKMLQYIYTNLTYPEAARKADVEGTSVLQFIVQKNGKLADIKLVRDPGEGTGEAAKAVIEKMNTDGLIWTPGKQRGRLVHVLYTLPVKFMLEDTKKP